MTVLARFTIYSRPATKKTSNQLVSVERGPRCPTCRLPKRDVCPTCKRSGTGRHAVLPSPQYRQWLKDAIPQIKVARPQHPPIIALVGVKALFYRERNVGDLVGYLQALADALEVAGMVENDRQIKSFDGSRTLKDAANSRIEVTITLFGEAEGELFEEES